MIFYEQNKYIYLSYLKNQDLMVCNTMISKITKNKYKFNPHVMGTQLVYNNNKYDLGKLRL